MPLLNLLHERRVDIRARRDRPARPRFFLSCLAHGQYLERENDLSAAQRIVAIDSQRLVVQPRHEKAAGLAFVIFHEDGSSDLPIVLGNVLDVIGKDERLVTDLRSGATMHSMTSPADLPSVQVNDEPIHVSVNVTNGNSTAVST